MDNRLGKVRWGRGNPRVRTSKAYWRQPLAWDLEAARAGVRARVFCASLADVFDGEVPAEWLADLTRLIYDTPNLDWLILTKRPQLFSSRLKAVDDLLLTGYVPLHESSSKRDKIFPINPRLTASGLSNTKLLSITWYHLYFDQFYLSFSHLEQILSFEFSLVYV